MNEVKEWSNKVIQKTCEQLSLPEELVTAIHKFQWKRAKVAIRECNQVEFSGLGKFCAKYNRIQKLKLKFENLRNVWVKVRDMETDPERINMLEEKIEIINPQIEDLNNRLEKLKKWD